MIAQSLSRLNYPRRITRIVSFARLIAEKLLKKTRNGVQNVLEALH